MAKFVSEDNLLYFWQKIKNLFAGKVDKVDGKGLSSNDYTSTEKTKLAGISAGAQVNVLEGIQVNGKTVTPTNKIANIEIANVYKAKGSITWSNLIALTTAEVGDVYNVTDKGGANYVCIVEKKAGESSWDKLGETVDLSGYYTSTQVDTKISEVEEKIPTDYVNLKSSQNITGTKTFKYINVGDGTYSKWGFSLDSDGNLILRDGLNMVNSSFQTFNFNSNGTLTHKAPDGTIKTYATLDDIGATIEALTNAEIDTILAS